MSNELFQIDPREYLDLDVYAVIGNPIAHSLSPEIHSQFATQTQQKIHYGKIFCELGGFKRVVEVFFARGGMGLNVTVPFKSEAFNLCTKLTDRAWAAGAVNVLTKVQGIYCGDNSDGVGLVRDLEQASCSFLASNILIIGAGGAVQGTVLPLMEKFPARIVIANRTLEKAQKVVERFNNEATRHQVEIKAISIADLTKENQAFDLIINCTSSGLNHQSPLTDDLAKHLVNLSQQEKKDTLVYEMVYGKITPFLEQFNALGSRTRDGFGMLVEQAAVAFESWISVEKDQKLDTFTVLQGLRKKFQN
ncbi:MAG: shikimate dehydrogenase [Betaproteobacteria bacterium]|jgi:shikimate dehydrogenase